MCIHDQVWDAAVVLARCLEFWGRTGLVDLHGARVVELGAGCGLTGCVAAALGAHVLLTDQAERLSLLQHNVSLNAHLFRRFVARPSTLQASSVPQGVGMHAPQEVQSAEREGWGLRGYSTTPTIQPLATDVAFHLVG